MAKLNTKTANDTNSANTASEENNAQALIARADKMLGDLDAELRTGIDKVERKNNKLFDAVFAVVYTAIAAIEDSGETEAFLASRGIRPHGNVKNPYFLM